MVAFYAEEQQTSEKLNKINKMIKVRIEARCRRYIQDQARDKVRPCRESYKAEMISASTNKEMRFKARRELTSCIRKARNGQRQKLEKCLEDELQKKKAN